MSNKLSLQKLLNSVTGSINFYSNNLITHSYVIGVPMLISSIIQFNKNIMDDPEYKDAVTGFMIFNIIMFLQFISRNNYFSKFDNVMLFLVYIVSSSAVIALINLDEIPHNEVNTIMLAQSICTPFLTWMAMFN